MNLQKPKLNNFKKETHSLELHTIVDELGFLINSKIDNIFQNQKLITLKLYVPNKGKKFLHFLLPSVIFPSESKFKYPIQPPGFCMFLRKHIKLLNITKIIQRDFERILEIHLAGKTKTIILVEFFGRGNLVLCDENYNILGNLSKENTTRIFNKGEKYPFPDKKLNPFIEDDLNKLLKLSKKEELVKVLATEYSLGGFYAENILKELKIPKDKAPKSLSKLKKYFKQFSPKNTLYLRDENPLFCRVLSSPIKNTQLKKVKSLSGTLSEIYSELLDAPTQDVFVGKNQRILDSQKKQLEKLKKKAEDSVKKAESLYEQHIQLTKLLKEFNELKKIKERNELKKSLKQKYFFLKDIDFKEKQFILEF